jgi:hypothetical protein
MTTLGRWFLVATLCSFASCSEVQRETAQKTLRQVGTTHLRAEAARLYKELFVAPTSHYFVPKADQWPLTFRRFEPLRVRAYADGFALALADTRAGEEGLYVVPQGMDNTPRAGANARFQRIEDGIYWYWFQE